MKDFIIGKNDADQRLDKFILKVCPRLPSNLMQKYIRLKRIKVNKKRAERDLRLNIGDLVEMYVNDEFFEEIPADKKYLNLKPQLNIVYEDENILLLDKRPGISVHEDEDKSRDTLIDHIQAYLYQKNEWNPDDENSFAPALCNRIDRNTGGIVIAAKNAPALRVMNEKIKLREMKKCYLCIVSGTLNPKSGKLEGFLWKDAKKNQVYVKKTRTPGAKSAALIYKTLKVRGDLSLVECELITGRTHQIRAQMADAGHPLLGDGKYGDYALNKKYKRQIQALYSYKLTFDFKTDAGCLAYLNGKTFKVQDVDFVTEYFA
ncbi:MAG: RluA family pseudouridine synthase [Clostridia bacterium]|nr:RluA family pseudouridine synthase [Clostridia bacterium]